MRRIPIKIDLAADQAIQARNILAKVTGYGRTYCEEKLAARLLPEEIAEVLAATADPATTAERVLGVLHAAAARWSGEHTAEVQPNAEANLADDLE